MIGFTIILQGDNAWPDLRDNPGVIHLANDAPPIQIAVLDGGMQSGKPSVALRIDLPEGKTVIVETSARLFVAAARAIQAKYPGI